LDQDNAERELSVQIRFRIKNHVIGVPGPADTKLYNDRETTTQLSNKSVRSAFIRVQFAMVRRCDGAM